MNYKSIKYFIKVLVGLLFMFSKTSSYAQNNKIQLVVLNSEGKLMQPTGKENGAIYGKDNLLNCSNRKGFRILVKGVSESNSALYYLRYEYRASDTRDSVGILGVNAKIKQAEYVKGDFLLFNVPINTNKDTCLVHYQLIKTNKWGAKNNFIEKEFNTTREWYENYQNTIIKEIEIGINRDEILASEVSGLIKESILNKNNLKGKLDTLKENLKKIKSLNEIEIEKYNAKLSTYKITLEKLSLLDQASGVVSNMVSINNAIIQENENLINYKSAEKLKKDNLNQKIKEIEKKIETLTKQFNSPAFLESKLSDESLKLAYSSLYEPVARVLHQGVLIFDSPITKEIIYEYNQQIIENTDKAQFHLERMTPTLPVLTTDAQLYVKITNINSSAFKDFISFNPDLIFDTSESVTEEDVRNGSQIQGLENVDFEFPDISLIEDFQYNKNLEIGLMPPTNEEVNKIKDWVKSVCIVEQYDYEKIVELWNESKGFDFNGIDKLLTVRVTGALNYLLELVSNSSPPENFNIILSPDIQPLVLDQPEKIINKYLTSIIKNNNSEKFVYADYLLPHANIILTLKKPKVIIKADTYYEEGYSMEVEDGKLGKPTSTIKKGSHIIAYDELDATRNKKRFALVAGIAYTPIFGYEYSEHLIAGTQNQKYLQEESSYSHKFVPTLFFTTYLRKTDLYSSNRSLLERLHFDVGIDYADADILDNFYVGGGWEPWRNVQISGGVRLGTIDRIDVEKVDPYTLDTSYAKKEEFKVGGYFAINFGFNLIPTAIKSLLNPAE